MKGFLCIVVFLISLFCLAAAKPQSPAAPSAPSAKKEETHPSVQVIRYKTDAEADAIIKNIIAQYEKLGGTSELHNIPNQVRGGKKV